MRESGHRGPAGDLLFIGAIAGVIIAGGVAAEKLYYEPNVTAFNASLEAAARTDHFAGVTDITSERDLGGHFAGHEISVDLTVTRGVGACVLDGVTVDAVIKDNRVVDVVNYAVEEGGKGLTFTSFADLQQQTDGHPCA